MVRRGGGGVDRGVWWTKASDVEVIESSGILVVKWGVFKDR
jgi:hypothetical protein